jgi:dienelactone hydrolase
MKAAAALGVLTVFLAACGGGGGSDRPAVTTPAVKRDPFAYDRTAALELRQRRVAAGQGGTVHDLSYASPRGGRVTAYLVLPTGSGRHPAVVLMHGSGADRAELLGLAAGLATRGIAALAIDSPFSRPPIPRLPEGVPGVRRRSDLLAQEIVDLRRGVDVLQKQPAVDPKRLGFLGFSAGARSGAILAGVEPRVDSFVLISGGSAPVDEYVAVTPAPLKQQVKRLLDEVDPLRWIKRARPGTIFFQNGVRDEVVPRDALVGLIQAAPRPQRTRWYDSGHSPTGRVQAEAIAWLVQRLRPR